MADELREKLKLLREKGFYTIPGRAVFYHPDLRVFISDAFLEDSTLDEIRTRIEGHENNRHDDIQYEFHRPPSQDMVDELLAVLRNYTFRGSVRTH